MKPCLSCGEPTSSTRCPECSPPTVRRTARERGYDTAWDRLSKRARELQPFCSRCYTTERLTLDHKPSAWRRKAEGKAIRLKDVQVLCDDCQHAVGSSRPGSDRARAETQGTGTLDDASGPRGKAQSPSHTPGGYL